MISWNEGTLRIVNVSFEIDEAGGGICEGITRRGWQAELGVLTVSQIDGKLDASRSHQFLKEITIVAHSPPASKLYVRMRICVDGYQHSLYSALEYP